MSLHEPLDRLDLDDQPGVEVRPGMVAHSPEYVAGVVLRALRTGEERIDIPHGPERPDLTG